MARVPTNIWANPETGEHCHANHGDTVAAARLTARGFVLVAPSPSPVIDDSGREICPPVVIQIVGSPASEATEPHPESEASDSGDQASGEGDQVI